jgi:His/Glu/Gln/Arg/opine family amino acid ABC transporter permease subunit
MLGILLGLALGGLLGILNCDRLRIPVFAQIIQAYTNLIRGTPVFVQLLIVYFALPEVLGFDMSAFSAGVITLGVNASAYIAEIIRGGINAVPEGQWEGAHVLGYSTPQTLAFIIMPQALRSILPAITNELATLIKESSILMIIGVPELVKVSRDIVARELLPMEIYLMTAAIYLAMTSIVALGAHALENKLK